MKLSSLYFFIVGFILLIFFQINFYIPLSLSLLLFFSSFMYLINAFKKKQISILFILIFFINFLPFIHLPSYLFFDYTDEPLLMWGLASNPYMFDKQIIELVGMICAASSIGMAVGVSIYPSKKKYININYLDKSFKKVNSISFIIWFVLLIIGFLLSWISAPKESIFVAGYTESKSLIDGYNFNSAWMISYVLISFLFCDALQEKIANGSKKKIIIVSIVILFIVIYFQLLRGDRESLTWVFSLLIISYFFNIKNKGNQTKLPWFKIISLTLVLFVVSSIIALIRSQAFGLNISQVYEILIDSVDRKDEINLSNYFHGTWSAVLLTPLSVAGDHINDLLPIKYGKDYLNLILSLPPGFVSDGIGYIRPIDSNNGPAWEMRYGIGGTHSTVLPFMNFRLLGVFFIFIIISFVVLKIEKIILSKGDVNNYSLYSTLIMVAPHWLWYGEKYLINALFIWWIFSLMFKFLYKKV